MSDVLSDEGYVQTKSKFAGLEHRLAVIRKRTDLPALHLAEVRRSYHTMMRQYLREIKLYEAAHALK